MSVLLSAENLTILRGNRVIVRQHHLHLARGQAVHLQGENGCGKSTLLQALAGLCPLLAGTLQRHADVLYLGHKSALQPYLSVRENLYYSARLHHQLSHQEAESALAQVLPQLHLEQHQQREARYLSAGQHHKTQLARLFFPRPPAIWLLDEPLTALDRASSDLLLKRIDQHLDEGGAVLMTTHHAFTLPRHPLLNHYL